MINFDSLMVSSKINNDEKQKQFEIDNKSLYGSLINICRNFSYKNNKEQKWLAMFAKNQDLIQKIR